MKVPEAKTTDRPASRARSARSEPRLTVGLLDYVARLISSFAAARLARRNERLGLPQLACFPRDYIGRAIVAHGLYEDLLLRCVFDLALASHHSVFANTSAVDVGANIGNHSCVLAKLFRSVIAFEPNPICARIIEANALMNGISNVELHSFALSDRNGRANLYLNSNGNLGGSRLSACVPEEGERIEVETRRGDDILLPRAGSTGRVSLVKIDVEGHEHAVIRGMEQLLKTDRPILMFESTGASGPDGGNAILDTLLEWGYGFVYTVEPNSSRSKSRLKRALQRVVRPYEVAFRQVVDLEDRYYSLIVVSCEPLQAP